MAVNAPIAARWLTKRFKFRQSRTTRILHWTAGRALGLTDEIHDLKQHVNDLNDELHGQIDDVRGQLNLPPIFPPRLRTSRLLVLKPDKPQSDAKLPPSDLIPKNPQEMENDSP